MAGKEQFASAQGKVVAPQAAHRDPIAGGDGREGLALLHGMSLPGEAENQGLAHSQGTAGGNGIIPGQAHGICAIPGGNGGNRFSGSHNVNGHLHHLFAHTICAKKSEKKVLRFFRFNGTMRIVQKGNVDMRKEHVA